MSLAGKKIVLGVSGGLTAHKTPGLVGRLPDPRAQVSLSTAEKAKDVYTPPYSAAGFLVSLFQLF